MPFVIVSGRTGINGMFLPASLLFIYVVGGLQCSECGELLAFSPDGVLSCSFSLLTC